MKVIDLIRQNSSTAFSFEALPAKKGRGIGGLQRTIERLREFDPKYINITTHHSEYVYTKQPDSSFRRSTLRRCPGTVAVAAAIQYEYGITAVPHILCQRVKDAGMDVPKTFHCDIPEPLAHEALKCHTNEEAKALGIEWAVNQCKELIAAGVPSTHFYTMSAVDSVAQIAKQIY